MRETHAVGQTAGTRPGCGGGCIHRYLIEAELLRNTGLAVFSRAATGDKAVELVTPESPDIAFVALDMPGAAAATKRILALRPMPPRVLLTAETAA